MIDDWIKLVRAGFLRLTDHRAANTRYPLVDLLSAGFAIFSLKDPSLLAFRQQFPQRQENLRRIYGLEQIPEDTALREGLDGVEPALLQAQFRPLIDRLKQQPGVAERHVLEGYTLLALDGTQHFCSDQRTCSHCLIKKHRNGTKTSYHQLLAAVWVQPGEKTVFPVAVEAITRPDGATKNDCERNAAKRLIPQLRTVLPSERLLLTFDALYANGPVISLLQQHDCSFVIAIKEGYVIEQVKRLAAEQLQEVTWQAQGRLCTAWFANDLMLNGEYQHLRVNYLDYLEVDPVTLTPLYFGSWITDVPITTQNVAALVEVGRTRWKIENETFNTLKNQGYHLEHNYGHGKKYLATNFAILTFLAFLVDQIAQCLDQAFGQALNACQTKRALWEKVRQVFDLVPALSMNAIYRFITQKRQLDYPLLE